jgi:hypothetical protein
MAAKDDEPPIPSATRGSWTASPPGAGASRADGVNPGGRGLADALSRAKEVAVTRFVCSIGARLRRRTPGDANLVREADVRFLRSNGDVRR